MARFSRRFEEYVSSVFKQNIKKNNNSSKASTPALYDIYISCSEENYFDEIYYILDEHFHKSYKQIKTLIETLNGKGSILCGTYTRDVAETKLIKVLDFLGDDRRMIKCVMLKGKKDAIEKP